MDGIRWPSTPPKPNGSEAACQSAPRVAAAAAAAPNRPAAGAARADPQPLQLVNDQVEPLALDDLHRVVDDVALLADLEDRYDVGVMEPRRAAGLAAEPLHRAAVRRIERGSTFSATWRPSEIGSASYTMPIPPRSTSRMDLRVSSAPCVRGLDRRTTRIHAVKGQQRSFDSDRIARKSEKVISADEMVK